jgi:hypothetical protein
MNTIDSMAIKAVVWTPEGVWYKGLSYLNYLPGSERDAARAVSNLQKNEYLAPVDLSTISKYFKTGLRYFKTVCSVVSLLMEAPWPFSWGDAGDVEAYRKKVEERLAGIGVSVSEGVTQEMIKSAVGGLKFTDGLEQAVEGLRKKEIHQAAASNDLAPFVYEVAEKVGGMDLIETAPLEVHVGLDRLPFEKAMLNSRYRVIGEMKGPYHCMRNALDRLSEQYKGDEIMLVGGIQPDIESMQRVKDQKGIAIGFNPDIKTQVILERRGMPVLKRNVQDLAPVLDIAKDPDRVEYWCM